MFPPFDEWCNTVLHPEDTHPWNFRTREFYEEYKLKYAIAKMIRPKSILEIGVRFGYSAQSFLFAVPTALYVGIDIDEPSWGSYKGIPREWAEKKLQARYPANDICTWQANTQTSSSTEFFGEQFDLIHIDADHSYKGALHDMMQFWPSCKRIMVVDDVVEISEVARAVRDFLKQTSSALSCGTTVTVRGAALIVREDDAIA